jgi:hypothetical protein
VENEEIALNTFEENPTTSQRAVSREIGMARSSLQRILEENFMHAYHCTRMQQLKPENYPIRRRFCEWLLNQNNGDTNFLPRVVFSLMRQCLVEKIVVMLTTGMSSLKKIRTLSFTQDFKKGFLSTCGPVFWLIVW